MWHVLTKKTLDLNRVGQVHRAASFVVAPWPVAISFVLGSQMSEQNYKEDCKILNSSNFWCVMNVHKLSLYFLFCSLFLQPQWGLGIFGDDIHPEKVYPKSSKDQGNKWTPVQWAREFKLWPLARDNQTTPKFQSQTVMRNKKSRDRRDGGRQGEREENKHKLD